MAVHPTQNLNPITKLGRISKCFQIFLLDISKYILTNLDIFANFSKSSVKSYFLFNLALNKIHRLAKYYKSIIVVVIAIVIVIVIVVVIVTDDDS